jgi:hypothetical protein
MKPLLKLLLFLKNITIISKEVNLGSHFSKKKEAVVNYLKKILMNSRAKLFECIKNLLANKLFKWFPEINLESTVVALRI